MPVSHHAVVPFSSAASSYALTLPTGISNGSRLYVVAAVAADNRTFTPSGGPTLTSLTPVGGTVISGHGSYGWVGAVGSANNGQVITFAQGGGNLKCVFGYFIVSDPHATAPDHLILGATQLGGTTHTAPSGTTAANGVLEVQIAADSRGATLPNTADWTPPAAMSSGSSEGFNTGSTAFSSMAIGFSNTSLNSGVGVGGDIWTADQSAAGSTWTIAVRTVSVTAEAVYTRAEFVEVDARGSTGAVTLVQSGGTAATITESPTGVFRIVKPAVYTTNLTFDLVAGGTDTEVITITPAGDTSRRLVYRSGTYQ